MGRICLIIIIHPYYLCLYCKLLYQCTANINVGNQTDYLCNNRLMIRLLVDILIISSSFHRLHEFKTIYQ